MADQHVAAPPASSAAAAPPATTGDGGRRGEVSQQVSGDVAPSTAAAPTAHPPPPQASSSVPLPPIRQNPHEINLQLPPEVVAASRHLRDEERSAAKGGRGGALPHHHGTDVSSDADALEMLPSELHRQQRLNNPDCDMPIGDPSLPVSRAPRELTWWRLAMITFVFTCTGPGGLEQVVVAGGPTIAIVGVLIVPIIFVTPQIFVVSELGAMMPTAAGNVVWVHRAFGRFAGFYNAWIFALTNMVDMAVYPVLFGDYVATTTAGSKRVHYVVRVAYRITGLVVGSALSLLSAKEISNITAIACAVTVIFIVVIFMAALPAIDPGEQWSGTADEINYSLLGSSLMWLYTGWTALGAMAGETVNSRVLLHGMSSALSADVTVYLMALIAALTVAKQDEWEDGYFVTAFDRVLPGIGPYFGASVILSALALYVSALICYSRSVWGMAEMGWAPKPLTSQLATGAPHVSVATHTAVAFCLVWFDFGLIVQIEYTVAATSYLLTYAAFLRLRYTEPDAPRPYVVPGGMPFAWLITGLKFVVMGATMIAGLVQDVRVLIAFVLINSGVCAGYVAYLKWWAADDTQAAAAQQQPGENGQNGASSVSAS